jgi:predicted RND superfamily exporter protein
VLFALAYTLVLVPAFFSLVPTPSATVDEKNTVMTRVLGGVAMFSWNHSKLVLGIVGGLIVFSIVGATKIEVGADFSAYFKADDPLFQDSRFIDANLGGTGSIDLMLTADDIRAPEVLHAMEEFETLMLDNPAILSIESPARLVRTLHERWVGDPDYYRLPGTLAGAAQLLAQTEGTDVHERLMLLDYQTARIRGRVRASDYRDLVLSMERIEAETAAIFEGVADAEITGIGKLVTKLDSYIVSSQVRSFLLAFATVALLLGLFFRSVKIGIWAMVPNGLPIIMVLGFMGWMGVMLDVATVMVASIMLGLVVDDTTHYLARYRLEWRALTQEQRLDPDERAKAALRTGVGTGRAITTTSLILACGFWVSLFASFQPNINFGLMGGAATIIAMVCDLVALPAVINLWPMRPDQD